jgi:threonyl-tRNA synthetase
MIHRVVLGAMERFLACLIEHYGGAFPVWLSPVQATIVPISDRHVDYAHEIGSGFRGDGIRVRVDDRSERMNLKIREAQMEKIPYMLVVGDKEMSSSSVSLRLRTGEDLGLQTVAQVRGRILGDIEAKS